MENLSGHEITSYLIESKSSNIKHILEDPNLHTDKYIFHIEQFIQPNICDWIVYECERYAHQNNGWNTSRHKQYPTTDLPIRSIIPLTNYLHNFIILNVFPLIGERFKLNMNFIHIKDLFVVNYRYDRQLGLDYHKDGGIVSCNILLNNKTDFTGGGTTFICENHEKHYSINKGDMLLHCGMITHKGNEIICGERYVLIGFFGYMRDYHLI